MLTGVNILCRGCDRPLEVTPDNATFVMYLDAPVLTGAFVECTQDNCPNRHNVIALPMQGDDARHAGFTLVNREFNPPTAIWDAAARYVELHPDAAVSRIGRMRLCGRNGAPLRSPGIRLFTSGDDPIDTARDLVARWSDALPTELEDDFAA